MSIKFLGTNIQFKIQRALLSLELT